MSASAIVPVTEVRPDVVTWDRDRAHLDDVTYLLEAAAKERLFDDYEGVLALLLTAQEHLEAWQASGEPAVFDRQAWGRA